jgi:SAM-dependent methyltransferase
MIPSFTLAIFLNAALLFLVQPLVGKLLLPTLGGTPAVWNTCLVFFQLVLLIGYGYAWLQSQLRTPKARFLVHLVVLAAGGAFLWAFHTDIRTLQPPTESTPIWWLLLTLAWLAGVPFFAISTTGPLLQKWFSGTTHPSAKDPYFLYAASNAGSLLGLLAYPFLIERALTLTDQRTWWTIGYTAAATLTLVCGVMAMRKHAPEAQAMPTAEATGSPSALSERITWSRRLLWIALAMVPSSLSMGCTQYLTTDIAAVPLLWVAPLAVYLLTFVLAFSKRTGWMWDSIAWGVPVLAGCVYYVKFQGAQASSSLMIQFNLILLLTGAWACHGRLASLRPGVGRLNEYFVWIAVGGALGGLFNALAAPMIFNQVLEYPIAIVACIALTQPSLRETIGRIGDVLARLALPIAAAVAAFFALRVHIEADGRKVIHRERTFFGIHTVSSASDGKVRDLMHGTTTHGLQIDEFMRRSIPRTYYHKQSPIGEVFDWLRTRTQPAHLLGPDGTALPPRVAAVGLGTGTLAYYAAPDRQDPGAAKAPLPIMTYYEIDPAIVRIAENTEFFTYIRDARSQGGLIDFQLGDARQELAKAPDGTYDVIVLDAFSSDAVPVHLLTREAYDMYFKKLAPGGVIASHVSNRHLMLDSLLRELSGVMNVAAFTRNAGVDEQMQMQGLFASQWIVMSRTQADAAELVVDSSKWVYILPFNTGKIRPWTDDFSNLMDIWK